MLAEIAPEIAPKNPTTILHKSRKKLRKEAAQQAQESAQEARAKRVSVTAKTPKKTRITGTSERRTKQ
jgi:hypothetical protein